MDSGPSELWVVRIRQLSISEVTCTTMFQGWPQWYFDRDQEKCVKSLNSVVVNPPLTFVVVVFFTLAGCDAPTTADRPLDTQLPSVNEVLTAHRQNVQHLASLHLQGTFEVEYTQAHRDASRQEAEKLADLLKQIETGKAKLDDFGPELAASGATLESLKHSVKEALRSHQAYSQNTAERHRFEIFIRAQDYQVRTPIGGKAQAATWSFPTSKVSKQTLGSDYANVRIFSRSARLDPPARVWCGLTSSGAPQPVLLMNDYSSDEHNLKLPPFTQVMQPRWDQRNPVDEFFKAEPKRYRVVREEMLDGRKVLVVDARVPHETSYAEKGANGKITMVQAEHVFRAWLDMARGAIPLKLQQWPGKEGADVEQLAATQSAMTATTNEIRELASGGFYPAVLLRENFEVSASSERKPAMSYVSQRMKWVCSLVETPENLGEYFFVLDFPPGQRLFDWENMQEVGALEPEAPVRAGDPAPPLDVVHWLDGKSRTLDDLRGRVIVIEFWGLWCGACRRAIPSLKSVYDRYRDRPVTFIALHTAEEDPDALAARIQEFSEQQGWLWLHAIDAGTMMSNSVTCNAYGARGFPMQVVIGSDGKVSYNSNVPPPGLGDIIGKTADEASAEDIKRMEAYMREQYKAAGIAYPADALPEEEKAEVMDRLGAFMLSREIDKALKALEERRR
jgi:thiol-disulfide isomerase/thioredoxin